MRLDVLNPDIVLIGGDVLEGDTARRARSWASSETEAQFRRLKPKYGVYGVRGKILSVLEDVVVT